MTTLTEAKAPLSFIVSEPEGAFRARDTVRVALATGFAVAVVLGSVLIPGGLTSAALADAGNTGNGVLTLDAVAPVGSNASNGDYRVVFNAATTFLVSDPSGKEIGKGAVGAAYAKEVKFVIAAGATAFVAGDAFTVTVGAEAIVDELYKPLDPTANDGSDVAKAIACYAVAPDAVKNPRTVVFNGPGEVRAADLGWPANITDAQKAQAVAELRLLGIKLR